MSKFQRAMMATLFVTLTTAINCKRVSQTSDLNTVGELSGGVDELKSKSGCSGTNTKASLIEWASTPGQPAGQSAIGLAYDKQIKFEANKDLAETNLSAIPHEMMGRFLSYGYELHFVKDINAACKDKRTQPLSQVFEHRDSLQTCVKESFTAEGQALRLYVHATTDSIKNNTVLGFIGLVGERFDRVQTAKDGSTTFNPDETADSKGLKNQLASSLLKEGAGKGVTFTLLEDMLKQQDPELNAVVANDIFNNVGDSFYCNLQTKQELATQFPGTFAIWRDQVDKDFQTQTQTALVEEEPKEAKKKTETKEVTSELSLVQSDSTEEGFGLWGRRHRPYRRWQPVRNGFRARNNQMYNNYQQTGFRRPRLAGYRRPWDGSRSWVMPPRWGNGRVGWRVRRGGGGWRRR